MTSTVSIFPNFTSNVLTIRTFLYYSDFPIILVLTHWYNVFRFRYFGIITILLIVFWTEGYGNTLMKYAHVYYYYTNVNKILDILKLWQRTDFKQLIRTSFMGFFLYIMQVFNEVFFKKLKKKILSYDYRMCLWG